MIVLSSSLVGLLNNHQVPIYEPELDVIVEKNIKAGRLSFTSDIEASVKNVDAVFIAVGTPSRRGDGHADLTFVYEVAREIAPAMNGYTVVVTKSTVPVGTGDEIEKILLDLCSDNSFDVVSNPEFLREGSAINDFMRPDRVVIGTKSKKAQEVMRELYRPLFLIDTPILFTARRTAELIKYAANTFLATKVSFANEMKIVCEAMAIDYDKVVEYSIYDERLGNSHWAVPGPDNHYGFGGSCFPKDINALIQFCDSMDIIPTLLNAVWDVNLKVRPERDWEELKGRAIKDD